MNKTIETNSLEVEKKRKGKKSEIKVDPVVKRKAINTDTVLSEKVLAVDWNRKEEDAAWKTI